MTIVTRLFVVVASVDVRVHIAPLEHLDAMVLAVAHEQAPVGAQRDALDALELALAWSPRAERLGYN